jgi:serine/threonine protein kinase
MHVAEPAQVLDGKYRLVRPLGRGGLGAVWHAEHLALHSPVAVKLLDRVTAEDGDALQRFLREARAAAALRSPHVVQILDYGVDDQTPYIVMELLEGESLAERLDRDKRLGLEHTARVVKHVARAISRAHDAGIIHRDLKPANIFLVRNDDEELVKVLDFGVAKATTVALGKSVVVGATPAGALLGTPHYMSPEQAQGVRGLDHRTDIWSLGVIAYECLLGDVPFASQSLGTLLAAICSRPLPVPSSAGSVPAGFDDWFARACARKPSERFASAKELSAAFADLCALANQQSVALARTQPAPPRDVQRPAEQAAPVVPRWRHKAQLLVAIGCGFAGGALAFSGREPPRLDPEPRAGTVVRPAASEAPAQSLDPLRGLGPPGANSAGLVMPGAAPADAVNDVERKVLEPTPAASAQTAPPAKPVRRKAAAKPKPTSDGAAEQRCNPPWFDDKAGVRRVRPECL